MRMLKFDHERPPTHPESALLRRSRVGLASLVSRALKIKNTAPLLVLGDSRPSPKRLV